MGWNCGDDNNQDNSTNTKVACCSSCASGGGCSGGDDFMSYLQAHKSSFVKGMLISGGALALLPQLDTRDAIVIFTLATLVDLKYSYSS